MKIKRFLRNNFLLFYSIKLLRTRRTLSTWYTMQVSFIIQSNPIQSHLISSQLISLKYDEDLVKLARNSNDPELIFLNY